MFFYSITGVFNGTEKPYKTRKEAEHACLNALLSLVTNDGDYSNMPDFHPSMVIEKFQIAEKSLSQLTSDDKEEYYGKDIDRERTLFVPNNSS